VIFNAEQCHKTVQNGKSYKAMQITTSMKPINSLHSTTS